MSSPLPREARASVCKFCGNWLLFPKARKCANCGEFQVWWLALLDKISPGDLALAGSVLAVTYVGIVTLLRGEAAAIDFKVVDCARNQISVAFFNTGTQPGVIANPVLYAYPNQKSRADPLTEIILEVVDSSDGGKSTFLVGKGDPLLRDFTFDEIHQRDLTGDCWLMLSVEKIEKSVDDIRPIINDACSCSDVR